MTILAFGSEDVVADIALELAVVAEYLDNFVFKFLGHGRVHLTAVKVMGLSKPRTSGLRAGSDRGGNVLDNVGDAKQVRPHLRLHQLHLHPPVGGCRCRSVYAPGFEVEGVEVRVWDYELGFGVKGLAFGVLDSWCGVHFINCTSYICIPLRHTAGFRVWDVLGVLNIFSCLCWMCPKHAANCIGCVQYVQLTGVGVPST